MCIVQHEISGCFVMINSKNTTTCLYTTCLLIVYPSLAFRLSHNNINTCKSSETEYLRIYYNNTLPPYKPRKREHFAAIQ